MRRTMRSISILAVILLAGHCVVDAQEPLGTAFSYQGQLKEGGIPAEGYYDFEFRLFDDPVGGTQIGGEVDIIDWPVTGGLFTVQLDFGTGIFTGNALWLEVEVGPSGDDLYILSPRQPVNAAPYALYALDGPGSAGFWAANGDDIYSTNSGSVGIGTSSPSAKLEVDPATSQHGIYVETNYIPVRGVKTGTGTFPGIHGETQSTSSGASGVRGVVSSTDPGSESAGVYGINHGLTAFDGFGVRGEHDGAGSGVFGHAPTGSGVSGYSESGNGLFGISSSGTGVRAMSTDGVAVMGTSTYNDGVVGLATGGSYHSGVYGVSTLDVGNYGVFGRNDMTFQQNWGFLGSASYGAYGCWDDTLNEEWTMGYLGGTYGVYGGRWDGNAGTAGYFAGKVTVTGILSKGGGSFKIDHPLDPENKYLYHSFVESPDMMNIYNGNVTTDDDGYAVVMLPEWFAALNRDFRYQLTVVGQFSQAMVAEKIHDNRFAIRTDKPNVEVSWQVTGIRQDPFANEYRIPVEQDKSADERGMYLHPEAYGQPQSLQIGRVEPLPESETPARVRPRAEATAGD